MRTALRLALVLITLASLGLFLIHPWWFPAAASAQAPALDSGLKTALWSLGALFVAGQIVLALLLGGKRDPSFTRHWYGNWRWEISWTALIAVIFFGFSISDGGLWSRMTSSDMNSGALRVEVTGTQFQWYFRYPGPDGTFGRVDAQKFARPDEGNPLGIDPADPAAKDDVVSSTLVLPVGRPVELDLRAQDVIHSVFIPAMRLKQDVVPGMDIRTHVTPTQVGTYELVCSQLCGLGHYRMKATVRVVTEQEFKDWLKVREDSGEGPGMK
jgi:cytochrome c oxidase subunit 2